MNVGNEPANRESSISNTRMNELGEKKSLIKVSDIMGTRVVNNVQNSLSESTSGVHSYNSANRAIEANRNAYLSLNYPSEFRCKRRCSGRLTLIGKIKRPLPIAEAIARANLACADPLSKIFHGSCASCSMCGDRPMDDSSKSKAWQRYCAVCGDIFAVNGFWAEHGGMDLRSHEKALDKRSKKHVNALIKLAHAPVINPVLWRRLEKLPSDIEWLRRQRSTLHSSEKAHFFPINSVPQEQTKLNRVSQDIVKPRYMMWNGVSNSSSPITTTPPPAFVRENNSFVRENSSKHSNTELYSLLHNIERQSKAIRDVYQRKRPSPSGGRNSLEGLLDQIRSNSSSPGSGFSVVSISPNRSSSSMSHSNSYDELSKINELSNDKRQQNSYDELSNVNGLSKHKGQQHYFPVTTMPSLPSSASISPYSWVSEKELPTVTRISSLSVPPRLTNTLPNVANSNVGRKRNLKDTKTSSSHLNYNSYADGQPTNLTFFAKNKRAKIDLNHETVKNDNVKPLGAEKTTIRTTSDSSLTISGSSSSGDSGSDSTNKKNAKKLLADPLHPRYQQIRNMLLIKEAEDALVNRIKAAQGLLNYHLSMPLTSANGEISWEIPRQEIRDRHQQLNVLAREVQWLIELNKLKIQISQQKNEGCYQQGYLPPTSSMMSSKKYQQAMDDSTFSNRTNYSSSEDVISI